MTIAVCGIDGSGKSTLIKALTEHEPFTTARCAKKDVYDNIETFQSNFPNGRELELGIGNPEYSIPFIWATVFDFLAYYERTGKPLLSLPGHIFLDRWTYCFEALGMLYPETGASVKTLLSDIPRPDLTIFLDIEAEEAYERIKKRNGGKAAESLELLKRLRQNYQDIFHSSGPEVVKVTRPDPKLLIEQLVNSIEDR